jgi:lipopolysaccharide transport system ATP-binding protein
LLRILAGVSAPTTGRMRVEGSISPLIGVGVGFNNELTGRENVYANGQILGMSKERIRREFDEIAAFSEIEDFLDVPVKFYSSGMYLRLAFAVAIQVRPEVMLVDEVLAVGDVGFQTKCVERMRQLQESGATVLVVTHSIPTLHRMCARTIVLSRGRAIFDGPTEEAISVYHDVMQSEGAQTGDTVAVARESGRALVPMHKSEVTLEIVDANDEPTRHFTTGEPIHIRVHADFNAHVRNPLVGLVLSHPPTGMLYMSHTAIGDYTGEHDKDRPLDVVIGLESPLLNTTYRVTVVILSEDAVGELGRSKAELFAVTTDDPSRGLVDLQAQFHIGGQTLRPHQTTLR